jgi:glycosyltransferase involved in cell wall biosynthesis
MTQILDILLWAGAVIWALLLLMGTLNALLVPDISRLKAPEPRAWPLVSFLVPARNEESGIRKAVASFCTQDYPAFEVIVVNDRSTDHTGQILTELQTQFPDLTVINGADPPPGWLGKPNALETARSRARGDWILMTDADAVHAPDLLRRAVAYALNEDLGMLVIRPRHVTEGILEAVLMSGVNFFFFVATPVFLVRHSPSPLFATGSPVFNLIRRDALEACGGFGCLKQAIVDDLEIGFQVKRAGYPVGVTFAGKSICHRMYRGARQTVQGFGKTTFPTIRKTPWILPLYFTLAGVVSLLPYYGFLQGLHAGRINVPAAAALVLMHACFAGIAWRYGEPWYITFLNPLRELGWLWIFARSFVVYRRDGLVWRGRSYAPPS